MAEGDAAGLPPSMLAAARSLRADAVAAEVANAFGSQGIRSVLLRGPSIERHLYADTEARGYVDADLLVHKSERDGAQVTLEALGFVDATGLGRDPIDRPAWSSTWVRHHDGGNVDLHWTVVGARAHPDIVWQVLGGEVESVEVAQQPLLGLNAPATALIVALHAAQHGVKVPRVRDDLSRAVRVLSRDTWKSATALAGRIDAVSAYAFGLRSLPAGATLADRLGIQSPPSVETVLRAYESPPTALGFDWLAQTPGVAGKGRFIIRKVFPDRAFMRVWFRPARGGSRPALVVAYLWRPVWLVWHFPSGFRSWLTARRTVDEHLRRAPKS
jgi:Uncharacterised nucleotidyltransferase